VKVALDARQIYRPNRRGTGKNLVDLYRHLARIRPDWEFVLFYQTNGCPDPFASLPNVSSVRVDMRGDRFDLWQQIRLPLAARLGGADILHCPANTGPRMPCVPMVVTIHDLIPLDSRFRGTHIGGWGKNVANAARKAVKIITPSEFSKQQIVSLFRVSGDKVVVNPWAPTDGYRKVTDAQELDRVRDEYGLASDQRYVFGFGGADPRKNTAYILEAWARVPAEMRTDCCLVLVGIEGPALGRLRRRAGQLGIDRSCRLHGFAPEEDLPALLSGAVFLCYPSRSEGFGLPILDAFACETPVLTSQAGSLPEVAGDAALLVDPEDVGAITAGMVRLLGDEQLREELVKRGCQRVQKYTWHRCAERLCRVFEDVAGFDE